VSIAAGAVVAALSPAAASAGFSSELVPLSSPATGGNTVVSDVAASPNGDTLVAWSEGGATDVVAKVRRIRPDGTLGPELTVSDGTQRGLAPTLAVLDDGRALIVWAENLLGGPSSLRGRWLATDDTLGPQFTIRSGGMASDSGEVAATAMTNDTAMVAWHNFTSTPGPFRRVEARRVDPGGTVGGLIFPTSGAGSLSVQVEPNETGGALFSWREGGQVAQSVSAADVPGTLQAPLTASASGVMSSDGHDHFNLVYRKGSPGALEYRALAADGAPGTERELDPTSQTTAYSISTNPSNVSLVSWANSLSADEQEISLRFIGPDGIPSPATGTFSIPGSFAPQVANGIAADGSGVIAWELADPAGADVSFGRVIDASGNQSESVRLSSQTGSASTPQVALAPDGVGVSAWREAITPTDPTSQARIYVRQILPAPSCPDFAGEVRGGAPTRFALACTGLQLEAPQTVSGPAHGKVTAADTATQTVLYTPKPGFDGTDTFTFAGVNRGGIGATRTATIRVHADRTKPKIKRFELKPKRVDLVAGARAPARRAKATFKLRYSEAATAKILIERRNACPKRPRAAKCRKFTKLGKLRARPAAKSAKVKLKPKMGNHKLERGGYRATAVATDRAGNRSKPKRLTFSVR